MDINLENQPRQNLDPETCGSSIECACRECGKKFSVDIPQRNREFWLRWQIPKVCADCAPIVDARYAKEAAEREEAERVQKRQEDWISTVPPLYRETLVEGLPAPSQAIYEASLGWQYGPQGLGFCGASGSGKTRVMFLLCERMLKAEGRRFIYCTSADFSHKVSRLASDKMDDLDKYLNQLCTTAILFIDDLGKGRMTDRVESELYYVIEQRSANLKPILFTANASGKALEDAMSADRGPAIIRRLREFCTVKIV